MKSFKAVEETRRGYHADATLMGWNKRSTFRVDNRAESHRDARDIRSMQPGNAAQRRRLAAAAWSQKGVEMSGSDLE